MPDDIEFDDLDTEDNAEENQAPADLVAGDAGFPDEEEVDVQLAPDGGDDKEAKGEGDEGQEETKHKRPNRLQRERRRVREERSRAENAESEVQRLLAENAALIAKGKPDSQSDDDIDREIQAKTKRFREVRAAFDPEQAEEEAQLIRDLAALELRKERKRADTKPADTGGTQVQQRPAAPTPHPRVQAWLDKNSWFDDPDHERETRRARAIDAQVHADGYRVEDEDYFEEVERRMEAAGIKIPGRKRQDADGSNGAGRKESIVAGRVDAPTGGKHSVILTRDDLANIQKLGMNPKDKAVLEEYARNKRREEQRSVV